MKARQALVKVWICGHCKREHGLGSCAKINASNCCVCLGCKSPTLLNGTQWCTVCTAHNWVKQAKRQLVEVEKIYDGALKKLQEARAEALLVAQKKARVRKRYR